MLVTQLQPPLPQPQFPKVRFTGVPEWTEAEDAPTKYSHAILRNFAVFRHPIKTAKAHNSKSDQLLHEEVCL